jgi:hypothetical protein
MSMCVAACDKTAMAGSYAELGGMVSVAMQTVPYTLVFPLPLLSSLLLPRAMSTCLAHLSTLPLPERRQPHALHSGLVLENLAA